MRECPICNGSERNQLFHQSFSSFSDNNLLDGYDVVACTKCGFCFSDNIPSQEKFDFYYRELSKYESNTDELRESPYDNNRFSIMVNYLKQYISSPDEHIAEVGCATGFLLSLIKKEGFTNLTGIDPSPGCTAAAQKHYEINVLTNTISNIELKDETVDILILVGVLEHIRDLDKSLITLRRLLKQDGKLFIVVPDGSQYFNGQDAPFQEFSVEHINFFGPKSLGNLMIKNGYSKIDITQTQIEVNYKTITPVILSVFKKEKHLINLNFEKDNDSEKNLESYIQLCSSKEIEIDQIIKKYISENSAVIVWGTGAQTLRLLANSQLKNANITAFVDSNPKYQGKFLNGVSVIAPETLTTRSEPILISTRAYQSEIETQIKDVLGLKNKVIKLY